jgi:hypothetical protein
MDADPNVKPMLADADLVLQFESLGDNCELGLVQRMAGAEPLGLLRFAGAPLRNLLRGLDARFVNIGEPERVRVYEDNNELMVKLSLYDFTYHTHIAAGEADPVALQRQQCKTIGFLADKLIADLENPTKILVFRQNEPLLASDLVDLRLRLSSFGPGILLWVQEACPGHGPGSVDVVDERMMVGYVRRLASRDAVPDLDYESWMQVLRRAWRIWQRTAVSGRLVPAPEEHLRRTDIVFGAEGNAVRYLDSGWSGPEAGYQWAVGERSAITLDVPGQADEYWLEMDVKPYLRPPLLATQRMDVIAGGRIVKTFKELPVGEIGCTIPGSLVAGKPKLEIVFNHPHAASPMLIAGEGDDRRLGVCFYRLSLVCA